MLDISKLISDFIVAQWLEDDPDDDDIAFTFDEYNQHNPKIQILIENGPDKKVWITRNIYRVEHSCKLSIYLRPVNYMPPTIDAAKATFLAIKFEVDRILNLKFGITGIQATELSGWKDIDFEVGRDSKGKTGKEPITFVAEQIIRCTYYEGAYN
jgi:hypothetical protein